MYKLVDLSSDLVSILDTEDDVTDTFSLDELPSLFYDTSLVVEGIVVGENEISLPNFGIKLKRVTRGSKFRLHPNLEQRIMLAKIFGCNRLIYNKMLADRIEWYNIYGESLVNHYNDYYDEFPFLREVPARTLQMTERNLNTAYRNFFRRVSKGDTKVGFPKFKKKASAQSFQTYNDSGCVVLKDGFIRLPKLGHIKVKQSRPVTGRIMTVTISKTPTDKYFVSMNTEEWIVIDTNATGVVGIDLGIDALAILDDGTKLPNPKVLDTYLSQLCFYQQKLARTKKGSNRRKKLQRKIARLHERVRNIRTDNIHKFTKSMIDKNQVIITEDLCVRGMMSNKTHRKPKRTKDRRIADASWYEFVRQFSYKANWYDRVYQQVDRFYPSTQLCSCCGYKNVVLRGNTSIRQWACPVCGSFHDRDVNAAINIKTEGLRLLNTA